MNQPQINMSSKQLPVVLISAVNLTAAKSIMSELIDNEVEQTGNDDDNSHVWRLVNKYYTMDVRVQPLIDRDECVPNHFEAHIIYLTADECGAEAASARRAAAGRRAPLRLLAAECAEPPAALGAWAGAARYELVALRELAPAPADPPAAAAGPFAESFGAERLRGALHAHVWPELRARARRPAASSSSSSSSGGEDDESESEDEDEDEEGAAADVERFAAALDALGALARAPPAGGGGGGGGGARAARAEAALAAFCRALGPRAPRSLAALAALPPERW